MARQQNDEVREFILQKVEKNPSNVATMAAREFSLTRTTIARYVTRLVNEGLITAKGNTRGRLYALRELHTQTYTIDRNGFWNEDTVWREVISPLMRDVRSNVVDLFQYGFTEMLNNVLDHSHSPRAHVNFYRTYTTIRIAVLDDGIGIFNKIQADFNLEDARTALLELSKGKLTSDKKRHSGEGIYFTSRMFDHFSILSGHLYYARTRRDADDWMIETLDEKSNQSGTFITMTVRANADWTTRNVFDLHQGDDVSFRKTHVPVSLGRYPGEQMVSRSQAKRILSRFTDFAEVILDFKGVAEIGQPFADEIFRVFRNDHPEIPIYAVNTNPSIDKVIQHVKKAQN
jgi:STAS-like domain of unknown function (DUF4325)